MSEYQYYEFQAIDRPLSDADRQALRGLSTRARITATSFTNEYHWGDLKGDPVRWMERWFPLNANGELSEAEVHAVVAAIRDTEKTALLCRLVAGDPHVAAELRRTVREAAATATADHTDTGHRTVAELRTRAAEIRKQAKAAAEARREAERQRRAQAAEAERRARLVVVRRRGTAVWREVETEIEKRNAGGYDRALALLLDLRALAEEDGTSATFSDRIRSLRDRHSRKLRFMERLQQVEH